ncbi:FadR/GntR family transcriptional regulator [Zobellella aerophila]|uniref:GntR family transcriptional regulator n=1 Tax=Zobellella aerophila TaxID=870480 RepID=A0ABP6VZ21_9GAMM
MIDKQAKHTRLYLQVANTLIDSIRKGQFKVGERLPPERDLAAQLDVSRASLREAMIALELNGVVAIRKGSGIEVLQAPESNVAVSDPVTPFELLEARELIEPQIAKLAARKATPEDIEQLRDTLRLMELALKLSVEALREAASVDADRQFHAALAEISANPLMQEMMEKVWSKGVRGALWERLDHHSHAPSWRQRWIDDHTAIFRAIEAKDEDAAYQAMLKHVLNVGEVVTNFDVV